MKITIHQPEHMPWLGLLDKISKADIFVLLDTVDFEKNYFQNRNKIRTSKDYDYITVPIEKHNHKSIKEIKIIYQQDWTVRYLGKIYNEYHKTAYFHTYYHVIKNIINSNFTYLIDLNECLLRQILEWFDITTPIIKASSLNLDSSLKSTDLLLEISKKLNADTYLSGTSGKDYLDINKFTEANINVEFHQFFHPVYKQLYDKYSDSFVPGMNSLDLLFNYGEKAKEILKGKGIGALELILNKIDYRDKSILEMFGGTGDGHLQAYANNCSNLTIWTLQEDDFISLSKKYSNAKILKTNSLIEMNLTKNKFDIIIIDAPAIMDLNLIMPDVLKILKNKGIIIFRNIIKSYNNDISVQSDKTLEEWDKVIGSNYIIKNRYVQPREYYFLDLWVNNFVYELERKNDQL